MKTTHPWVRLYKDRPDATAQIILFHHAGGSANYYQPLAQCFDERVRVLFVELPGRGRSFGKGLLTNFDEVVDAILQFFPNLLTLPTGVWGHSMGAALSFAVLSRLKDRSAIKAFFPSASDSPSVLETKPYFTYRDYDDQMLYEFLDQQGGVDSEIKASPVLDIFLPIIRADLQICASYGLRKASCIDVPITVMAGLTDRFCQDNLLRWRHASSLEFNIHWFSGGHFYFRGQEQKIAAIIRKKLLDEEAYENRFNRLSAPARSLDHLPLASGSAERPHLSQYGNSRGTAELPGYSWGHDCQSKPESWSSGGHRCFQWGGNR
jgi:surfactin synthase thioesterase subunit